MKLAWPYNDAHSNDSLPNTVLFEQRLLEVRKAFAAALPVSIAPAMTPLAAVKRAATLKRVHESLNSDAVVVLNASSGRRFDGRAVWDVMLCLGLRWGDMDLFHWENSADYGHDTFFSVSTSTPPGYFLPERIARGETQVRDLVFWFSIPRSANPEQVVRAMWRCANYAQSRLGGGLANEAGGSVTEDELLQSANAVRASLVAAGFAAGATATLHLF